jgi:thiosulfate/3-mercaptopyruvate sulfurtransferase
MKFRFVRQRIVWALCCVVVATLPQGSFAQGDAGQTKSATALPQSQLIQPVELVKILQSGKAKPLILNVGPHMIYVQAHIRGAEFIGSASDPEGLEKLRTRVKSLPHSTFIVLYCGCCPWTRCPNINPAFTELHRMGFTNFKALYIADDLGTDWVDKGYPTDLGNQ